MKTAVVTGVVSVSPGWVLGEYSERVPPEVLEAVVGDLPFTSGSIITVDGGRPLGTS